MQAVAFIPCDADELEETLRLHELYGKGGTRGADPDALVLLEEKVAITAPLQMQGYLSKLRLAHQKWCREHPGEDTHIA